MGLGLTTTSPAEIVTDNDEREEQSIASEAVIWSTTLVSLVSVPLQLKLKLVVPAVLPLRFTWA